MSEPHSSDPCARLKTQIPMHSVSWECPEIVGHSDPISLPISTFGIHLQPGFISRGQIIHQRTVKMLKASDMFALFLDECLLIDPEGVSCSLTRGRFCCSAFTGSCLNRRDTLRLTPSQPPTQELQ